jgi:alkylation response protein AidB-like acyl-CoA dehydrogenase
VDTAPQHVSHAKIAATDAAILTAETAIQVHGAMGYTYEVDLHYWMKRSWTLAGAWGSRAYHMKRVDDAVFGDAHAIGPEQTFA